MLGRLLVNRGAWNQAGREALVEMPASPAHRVNTVQCLAQSQRAPRPATGCHVPPTRWALDGQTGGLRHKALLPQSLHSSEHTFSWFVLLWYSRTDLARLHCSRQNNHLRRHIHISVTKSFSFSCGIDFWAHSTIFCTSYVLVNICLSRTDLMFLEQRLFTQRSGDCGGSSDGAEILFVSNSGRAQIRKSAFSGDGRVTEGEGTSWPCQGSLAVKLLEIAVISNFREGASWGCERLWHPPL